MEKLCSICKNPFERTSSDTYCKPCRKQYTKEWTEKNRERHNATTAKNRLKYKSAGPVSIRYEKLCGPCGTVLPFTEEFWNRSSSSSTGFDSRCRECSKSKQLNYLDAKDHRQKRRDSVKKSMKKLRLECLTHYSGGTPACACCGETLVSFLCIDHIDGGGNKDRKEKGEGGAFVQWLKRNNYPEGLQVLCHNCNASKHFLGQCEHKILSNICNTD